MRSYSAVISRNKVLFIEGASGCTQKLLPHIGKVLFLFYKGHNLPQGSTSVEKKHLSQEECKGQVSCRCQVGHGVGAFPSVFVTGYPLHRALSLCLWFWRPLEIRPPQLTQRRGSGQCERLPVMDIAFWIWWCWAFSNGPCVMEIYIPLFWALVYIWILAEKPAD